ncbi:MAG: hypothetical protein ABUL64_03220 [Singulisphaera sp.]
MKTRFFRLCHGPLDGRTIIPGTTDYARAGSAAGRAFAMSERESRGDRDDKSAVGETSAASPSPVHLYEPYDRIDELWLEIVLCKYVGTQSGEPGLN